MLILRCFLGQFSSGMGVHARRHRRSPGSFLRGEPLHAYHWVGSCLLRAPGKDIWIREVASSCSVPERYLTLSLQAIVVAVVYSELHTKVKITDQKHFRVCSRCPQSLSFTTYMLPLLSSMLTSV